MKGHGAADWSKRPLPDDWLNYAALDVEVLLELRDAIADGAARSRARPTGRHRNSSICAHSRPRRRDGIGGVGRRASTRCATRGRWPPCGNCGQTRDHIARRRDIAPGRILPDAAIINAATADPDTVEKLTALPVFGGPRQRRSAQMWLDALARARTTDDPPTAQEPSTGPPPASRWARRKPEAAARLEAARAGLTELSQQVSVPTENLVSPDFVRRLCWDWQPVPEDTAAAIDDFLRDARARPWQRELAVPVLAEALTLPASDRTPRQPPESDSASARRRVLALTLDVLQEVRQHRVGRLDLRPVPDVVVEHHDVGIRDDLQIALAPYAARVRVDGPVDQPHRDVGLRASPAPTDCDARSGR